jgi:hypothetical protein
MSEGCSLATAILLSPVFTDVTWQWFYMSQYLIDLRERGWCGMDWIHLAQDRVQWMAFVNMVINILVP